jgi:hypothetical protein
VSARNAGSVVDTAEHGGAWRHFLDQTAGPIMLAGHAASEHAAGGCR